MVQPTAESKWFPPIEFSEKHSVEVGYPGGERRLDAVHDGGVESRYRCFGRNWIVRIGWTRPCYNISQAFKVGEDLQAGLSETKISSLKRALETFPKSFPPPQSFHCTPVARTWEIQERHRSDLESAQVPSSLPSSKIKHPSR